MNARSRKCWDVEQTKPGRTVTVTNAASRYARLVQCTASYPTYSPHCNCSCSYLPHKKTIERRLNNFYYFTNSAYFLLHFFPTFYQRISNARCSFAIPSDYAFLFFSSLRSIDKTNSDNIRNTQDWVSIFGDHDSLHLSAYIIYLSSQR